MKSPTDILRDEHRVILVALTTLERGAERLAAGKVLPGGWWDQMLEWLRAFADRNHHAKEDEIVWPLAEAVLDDQAIAAVAREFEAVEAEQGREASIDYQEAVMKRLGEALG